MEDRQTGNELNSLRQRAEEIVAQRDGGLDPGETRNLQELLHEIGVRQVELELQNDELKQTQQELVASRNRYRELYDFAPIGYLTIRPDERIAAVNLAAADLFFSTRSEMTGEPLSRFILPDDRPAFRECLQRARDSETGSSAEVRILAGEPATTINTEVTANTVDHLAESGADGFRLSITDISELKRIEQELRRERANLERRIKQRTAELQSANESLRKEIEAREEIEQKLRRNQIRLRALASELTKTEERQRSRLARDLHDLVAQTLAVAKMKLSTMIQRVDDEEVADALHETEDLVQQMVEATREILTELSPPVLEEQDVPTAMEWLVDYLRDKYELNAELATVAESAQLSDEKRRFLFRSVRELLLNVARHAEAEHAWVDLSTEDGSIVLTVQDDGHGFNVAEARRSSGFGIFSIQQRVEDLGGSFVLDSSVGEGTRSVLTLPHG